MTTWAVIPAKAEGQGKNRLAAALDDAARQRLIAAMLARVVAAAEAAPNVDRVALLGPSRHGLPDTLRLLEDRGGGLNPALSAAIEHLAGEGASRAVIVAGDLPQVTAQEVELLAAAAPGSIAIAPDRHGNGTNALSLPLPAASRFAFAFGADSFARHHDAAEALGLTVETIHSQGLARDIDEPTDLPDAADLV